VRGDPPPQGFPQAAAEWGLPLRPWGTNIPSQGQQMSTASNRKAWVVASQVTSCRGGGPDFSKFLVFL